MSKSIKNKYYVTGTHCSACKLLIEKEILRFPNVKSVDVSLADKTVTVDSTKKSLDLPSVNSKLTKSGYSLSTVPNGSAIWNSNSILISATIFLGIAVAYLLLKSFGIFQYSGVNEQSPLTAFVIFGLIAGFSSCAALVGGFLLSLSKKWNSLYGGDSLFVRSKPFIMFNVGRLVSYAILGGVLGLIGSVFQLTIGFNALLVLLVSFVMIVTGLQMLGLGWASRISFQIPLPFVRKLSDANNFQGRYMPFLAGFSTFFLPCGFTLIVQAIALTTGSFAASASIMFAFALGTLIPLMIISFSSIKLQTSGNFAGVFNLVVGIMIVLFGLYNINSQLVVLGLPNTATVGTYLSSNDSETQVQDPNVELVEVRGVDTQLVSMRAVGFEYFPESLTLQAGVPTVLNVSTDNVIGCAQAMSLRGLYDEIVFLNKPEVEVNFTPKKGTYYISCTMGMVKPVVVKVI